MSDPNAIRITDLKELTASDLAKSDLIELVDKNGDPNGNPASRAVPFDELENFLNLTSDLALFSEDGLAIDTSVKFNDSGKVERNAGFVILQTDILVTSTAYEGELAVFLWTTNSNASTASVSLFTSTDSIFEAATGSLGGTTGTNGKITFSVGTTSDNEPPFWVENRLSNDINLRLHTF